jgi:hypothetical protein
MLNDYPEEEYKLSKNPMTLFGSLPLQDAKFVKQADMTLLRKVLYASNPTEDKEKNTVTLRMIDQFPHVKTICHKLNLHFNKNKYPEVPTVTVQNNHLIVIQDMTLEKLNNYFSIGIQSADQSVQVNHVR